MMAAADCMGLLIASFRRLTTGRADWGLSLCVCLSPSLPVSHSLTLLRPINATRPSFLPPAHIADHGVSQSIFQFIISRIFEIIYLRIGAKRECQQSPTYLSNASTQLTFDYSFVITTCNTYQCLWGYFGFTLVEILLHFFFFSFFFFFPLSLPSPMASGTCPPFWVRGEGTYPSRPKPIITSVCKFNRLFRVFHPAWCGVGSNSLGHQRQPPRFPPCRSSKSQRPPEL
ncbi:uncharacterized protein LY79DRAFT_49232 [Colletotrichum navitas]|uniref:Uncharacterized protein n=1 Tax=Colletotrichum navitas TaxID=681940 RepID=A0AAD8Q644_9PEZI|nr:uncharacterized protein LY79DRAFT_49232 [Colletotrichum navitas]KAK1596611.1 hypothetical protein LY79DRAFT_49232 [Colletotrichum navitas]